MNRLAPGLAIFDEKYTQQLMVVRVPIPALPAEDFIPLCR
jgi:hypothetical protein